MTVGVFNEGSEKTFPKISLEGKMFDLGQ